MALDDKLVVRFSRRQRDRWNAAANQDPRLQGNLQIGDRKLSAWVRLVADEAAAEALEGTVKAPVLTLSRDVEGLVAAIEAMGDLASEWAQFEARRARETMGHGPPTGKASTPGNED
jgi:hypothetical protein